MRILPLPPTQETAGPGRRSVGYGITWDPEWLADGRLRVRGYRSVNAPSAVTADEFDALALVVDDTLAGDGWSAFEREAVRVVLRRLYAADLAGWPRLDALSPGMPPSLEIDPRNLPSRPAAR